MYDGIGCELIYINIIYYTRTYTLIHYLFILRRRKSCLRRRLGLDSWVRSTSSGTRAVRRKKFWPRRPADDCVLWRPETGIRLADGRDDVGQRRRRRRGRWRSWRATRIGFRGMWPETAGARDSILPVTRCRSRHGRWVVRRRTAAATRNRVRSRRVPDAPPAIRSDDRRGRPAPPPAAVVRSDRNPRQAAAGAGSDRARPAPAASRSDCKRTAAVAAAVGDGTDGDCRNRAPAVAVAEGEGTDGDCRNRAPAVRSDRRRKRAAVRSDSSKRVARTDDRRGRSATTADAHCDNNRDHRRGSWARSRRRRRGDRWPC